MKRRLLDITLILLSFIIAVVVGFYIVPKDNKQTRETTMLVQLKNDLGKNQMVRDTDLEVIEKGSYGLSKDTIFSKKEIVGKYAKTDLPRGIVAEKSFFQNEKEPVNAFLYDNPEFDGISFATDLTRSVAGLAEKGDLVRAIIFVKAEDRGTESRVLMPDELSNLEIISISNNRGKNLSETDDKTSNDNAIPAVVTVKANKNQQALLVKYMNDGVIHLSLRPRISKLMDGSGRIEDSNVEPLQGLRKETNMNSQYIQPTIETYESDINEELKGKGFGIN